MSSAGPVTLIVALTQLPSASFRAPHAQPPAFEAEVEFGSATSEQLNRFLPAPVPVCKLAGGTSARTPAADTPASVITAAGAGEATGARGAAAAPLSAGNQLGAAAGDNSSINGCASTIGFVR